MDADVRGPVRRRRTAGPGTHRALTLRGALLAALVLAACSDAPAARETAPPAGGAVVVTDAAGRSLRFERPPARVISLVPSVTNALIELGAGAALVGRTDYDT